MKVSILFSTILAVTVAVAGAHAQTEPPKQPVAVATAQSEGEIRRIDKEVGKVTLRHGPIENLDMPAMTMVFRYADPTLLQGLKEGDKVRFAADRVDGVITVTRIEAAR
jgi:Cu(I)/Ag(I) efflux system periplasmic protein CusF